MDWLSFDWSDPSSVIIDICQFQEIHNIITGKIISPHP